MAVEKSFIRSEIDRSDRVICLGHGLPQGLLGHNCRLIIDDNDAELFRQQTDNIYIWCNADCYVRKHDLKGFATGMFISEPTEAYIFGVEATQEEIEKSNDLFAEIVGASLEMRSKEILEKVLDEYQIADNDVVAFNRNRMCCFD